MRLLVMPFLRYVDFKGRSGRTEFWTFFGLSVAVFFLAVIATGLSTEATTVVQPKVSGANASPVGAIAYVFWWLASIVPWFAVQVRRFHDQGRSGWLCLVGACAYVAVGFGAMPLAAILFVASLVMMALPGNTAESRYGPPIEKETDVFEDGVSDLDAGQSFGEFEHAPESAEAAPAIAFGHDGRHYLKGRPFDSLVEAERAARRLGGTNFRKLGNDSPPAASSADRPTEVSALEAVEMNAPGETSAVDLPDDVTITDDGRYLCRG